MSPDQQCFWLTQLSSKPRHCIHHTMQTRFQHGTDSGADDYDQPKLRHNFFDAFSSPVRAQAKYFPNGEIPPNRICKLHSPRWMSTSGWEKNSGDNYCKWQQRSPPAFFFHVSFCGCLAAHPTAAHQASRKTTPAHAQPLIINRTQLLRRYYSARPLLKNYL